MFRPTSLSTALAEHRDITDEARLKQLALRFLDDYPDAHGLAYATAWTILRKHSTRQLDPAKVYWHRFSTAVSSSRTFTGWKHSGTPSESMTLVELVMHRFNARDQDASDELQVYGGFYTDGPDHGEFDERNEVAMLPQTVLSEFWNLDLRAQFTTRIADFWQRQSDTFDELATMGFLTAAAVELRAGTLSRADYEMATTALHGKVPDIMTLQALRARPAPPPGLVFHTFDIGGQIVSGAIRMVAASGRQIIYLPTQTPAFHAFNDDRALYQWVQGRIGDEAAKKAFQALILRSAAAREIHGPALLDTLTQIHDTPWSAAQRWVNQRNEVISGDVLVYLRGLARRHMEEDAQVLLTSNGDLRKRMWIGYLNAFINVFGGVAPLGWPLALSLIGAAAVNVGLNVDQAINAADARQRKAGIIGAVLNSIYLLFNLPLLTGAGRAMQSLSSAEIIGSEGNSLASASAEQIPLLELSRPLDGLEGNIVFDGLEASTSPGHMQGVYRLANGQTWISMGNLPYRVIYRQELNSWVIIRPDNPFSFYGTRPVRLDANGHWQLAPSLDLPGGSPMEPVAGSSANTLVGEPALPRLRSTFWDTYMQFNALEEERLSERALARQKAQLSLPQEEPGDRLVTNSDGLQVLVDSGGDVYRVFQKIDGTPVAGRISQYTVDDVDFNQYLRTGVARHPQQVQVIEELLEELDCVGYDNSVTLYRGGSGARGTSGVQFRSGAIKLGDVLVNTDLTSFSENPYLARAFASSQAGAPTYGFSGPISFDETSVVFELPEKSYLNATPIAAFSTEDEEAESLFAPGHYFLIEHLSEVHGNHYRFVNVRLREIVQPPPGRPLFELRTGLPFSREQYVTRLGEQGKDLVNQIFPPSPSALNS